MVNSGSIWDGQTYYQLYESAYTPWEWHKELFKVAKEECLICFSSPFDFTAVDFLEELGVPAYKIASFEITDTHLIEYVASKGKPIILSTGIAGKEDIILALDTCKKAGNDQVALLKCTSSYPAPFEEANLKMIKTFKEDFDVIPGLSDHTMGATMPIVAVAMGAKIIEKHFILDRAMGGPDADFSMTEKSAEGLFSNFSKSFCFGYLTTCITSPFSLSAQLKFPVHLIFSIRLFSPKIHSH